MLFLFYPFFCENYRSPNFGGPGKEEKKVEFDIKHRGSKMLSSKSSLIRRRWGRRRMQVSSLFTNHQQDKVLYALIINTLQEKIVDTILPSIGRGSVTDYDIPMSSKDEDEVRLVNKDNIEEETDLDGKTSPMNIR